MVVYGAAKAALARLTQGMAMEVFDGNIAVNLVAPSGAIITPGAAEFIPEGLDDEPIEYIAAVAFDLVHRPPSERTGIVAHSMHYAKHYNVPVTGLDGKGLLPSHEIPTWVHPDIISSGMD
jgi:3-oxoacyl-[acyl-carrier protein] reductase